MLTRNRRIALSAALFASGALTFAAAPAAAQNMPATAAGQEALDILKEAIAVPTVERRGQVPVLAEKIKARLLAAGFKPEDVSFTPVGETGYFTARIPGRDRRAKPIMIIGHLDVVEAKASDWTRDPFVPVVENGFVFGRGSSDNKGDVSITLATLMKLKREGWVPSRDVILALSGDEETGMTTTQAMANAYKNAELVLNIDGGGGEIGTNGKPVLYTLQAGEKVYADYQLTVTDPGGHSSRPGKTNAIGTMSAALGRVAAYKFPPQVSPLTKAYWIASADTAPADLAKAMRTFANEPGNAAAADLLSEHSEYVGLVRTTCVPTMISGGHAQNALPQSVTANINCRIFPGTTRVSIKAELERIAGEGVKIVQLESGALEAPDSPLRPDVLGAVTKAVHARAPGIPVVPSMSQGATDSIHFRAKGIPSYGVATIFMAPADDFSHGLNERVPVATIDPGVQQMETMLRAIAK